jgi:hypothetical protein
MSKLPVRRATSTPKRASEPSRVTAVSHELPTPRSAFRFHYSFTEISAVGDTAHVKHARTRFDDGKLTSESFEGTFDRATYDEALRSATEHLIRQSATMLRSMLWLLPPSRRDDD